jgi:hypothetical protein
MGVGTSTVGAIIASRRTHNPIGWLLCASGLVFGVVMFASEYAIYTLLGSPGSLPAGEVLAPVNPLWVLGFNLFVLILILFPTGQLPRACYELGRKSHRNADSTVGPAPSRSTFPAFLSRF